MEEKKIDKQKLYFWIRFAVWIITSLVIPIAFINYRYELFTKVSKVSLSGWCLLVGVIVFVFSIILDIPTNTSGDIMDRAIVDISVAETSII